MFGHAVFRVTRYGESRLVAVPLQQRQRVVVASRQAQWRVGSDQRWRVSGGRRRRGWPAGNVLIVQPSELVGIRVENLPD